MPTTTRRPRSRATVFLTVASLFSLAVLFVGIAMPAVGAVPRVAWRLFEDGQAVQQLTTVTPGTPIGVTIHLPFPAHVYVASWSALQGTIALFPSHHLSTDLENPLPAGAHWLPGILEGRPMTWPTHAVVGPIYYLLVVAREPLPALAEGLRRVKQMGHLTRLGPMYVFPESDPRAEARDKQRDMPAEPELDAARTAFTEEEAQRSDGDMRELATQPGVFVRALVVRGH